MYNIYSTALLFVILNLFLIQIGIAQTPANDNCANAISLAVNNNSCTYAEFTNNDATAEDVSVAPNPSCAGYQGYDVWFTVVMPASGALRLETRWLAIAGSPSVSVFSGACGNLTEAICYVNDGGKTIVNSSLSGQTLYVRVYGYYSISGRPFKICAFEPTVPSNDNCINAISLTVGATCNVENYSNKYATKESLVIAPDPNCQGYLGGDVWFKFTMPNSGSLQLEVDNLENSGPLSMVLYSGMCGNFTEEYCITTEQSKTIRSPQLAGQSLYLRMYRYITEEGNNFELCVFDPEIPPNDDCANAIPLTVGSTCNISTYSNKYATEESLQIAPNPICQGYEGSDVWFTFTMPNSGSLRLQVDNLENAGPVSMVLYSGTCGNFTEEMCIPIDQGKTIRSPQLGGKKMYLRMYRYISKVGNDFELCLFEPQIPSNDDCESSINLPVTLNCDLKNYSNAYATNQPVTTVSDPTCGQYRGGDVWFNVTLPSTGVLSMEINKPSGSGLSVAAYSGVCGDLNEVACFSLNKKPTLYEPSLAGKKVYLRIYSYGTEEGAAFTFCVYDPGCIPVQTENTESICQGESFDFGTLTLTESGAYSQTFKSSNGCDSLVNLTLQVNPIYFIKDTVTVCYGGGYTFYDGQSFNNIIEQITHVSNLTTKLGCDSIYETTLEIHSVNTFVSLTGSTLTAETLGAEYQWVDCNLGNQPITGEINQSFMPSSSGSYGVVISENGCEASSVCNTIVITSTEDDFHPTLCRVFPNPSNEDLFIKFPGRHGKASVSLINSLGQILYHEDSETKSSFNIRTIKIPSGSYILHVVVEGRAWNSRQVIIH